MVFSIKLFFVVEIHSFWVKDTRNVSVHSGSEEIRWILRHLPTPHNGWWYIYKTVSDIYLVTFVNPTNTMFIILPPSLTNDETEHSMEASMFSCACLLRNRAAGQVLFIFWRCFFSKTSGAGGVFAFFDHFRHRLLKNWQGVLSSETWKLFTRVFFKKKVTDLTAHGTARNLT